MSTIKISAVIITFNEAQNIERCLCSLKDVADEIVVLDSYSTDDTEKICREHDVTFVQREWEDYSTNKNYLNGLAKFDYLLSIDADEELSEELRISILKLKKESILHAYTVNRRLNYCGKWINYCGWYPDKRLRLWDRQKGKWVGTIHEKVVLSPDAKIGHLNGDILHYSFRTIADHLLTANNFSDIAAQEAYESGKSANFIIHILLNPMFTFFRKYFLQLGILDGYYGFIICKISAFANFLKYSKLRELGKRER